MDNLKIYISAPPQFAVEAALHGAVSVMAYRVGRDHRLMRSQLPPVRAELMDVDCSTLTGYGPHEALAGELTRECRRMGCAGIILDLPRPTPQLTALCALIDRETGRRGIGLYVPERYAPACPGARIVLPAQNLSGTYQGRLTALVKRWGPERISLELERVHTDFALPARAGRGVIVPERGGLPGQTFYSRELAANYKSFLLNGRAHLELWDDLASLREKIRIASALGIREFFLYYPHVADILDELVGSFSPKR